MKDHYNVSLTSIAMVGSAATGLMNLGGPLVAISVNYLGCKITCLLGLAVCLVAMVICYLVDSFLAFKLCYGFLMGIGFSLLHLPSSTSASFFFKEKKSFATGIALSGGGLGFIVLGIAFTTVKSYFGVKAIFIFNGLLFLGATPLVLAFYPSRKEAQNRSSDLSPTTAQAARYLVDDLRLQI